MPLPAPSGPAPWRACRFRPARGPGNRACAAGLSLAVAVALNQVVTLCIAGSAQDNERHARTDSTMPPASASNYRHHKGVYSVPVEGLLVPLGTRLWASLSKRGVCSRSGRRGECGGNPGLSGKADGRGRRGFLGNDSEDNPKSAVVSVIRSRRGPQSKARAVDRVEHGVCGGSRTSPRSVSRSRGHLAGLVLLRSYFSVQR